jgi:hypothetical protein
MVDVNHLTDSTGQEVATYSYDTWDNLINKTGTIDTPFTYRGKYGYVYNKGFGEREDRINFCVMISPQTFL